MGRWTHSLHPEVKSFLLETDSESHLTSEKRIMKMKEVTGCTQSDCRCESFQPGRHQIRSCDRCAHGWMTHALGKVCGQTAVCSGQVEVVQSKVVFDISSLILYGTQALPVRIKILLDRLFSVLTQTQVLNIIHTLGWTLRDYSRGYMLQDSVGKVLDRWVIMSPEEELVTLQQFLRFGETRSIVELMVQKQRVQSETSSDLCSTDHQRSASFRQRDLHHFQNLPQGKDAFLQPCNSISPSTTSLFPASPAEHRPGEELQPLGLNKQRRGADEGITQAGGDDRPSEQLVHTVKHATRPPKNLHEEHQVGDLSVQVRLVEAESSVADSSSSSGRPDRRHGSFNKGRVSCSVCAKTFYDKGTLKIHFNAVHLKIKHRCTIEGCSMMFSSLRSRNRHSANPNPRLHASHHTTRPSNPRASAQSCRLKLFVARPVAKTSRPVLPFHRTPPVSMPTRPRVSMATSNTDPRKHHFSSIFETHTYSGFGGGATGGPTANENDAINMMPKKKPRKSSTPLKFKRENCHDNRSEDDDEEASGVRVTHMSH